MTEAIQDDKPLDESLLNQDLNGAAAPKKGEALSIKGTPREGGARLSKNFKKVAFIGGSVVVGGMVIGILTAGNKSQPAESSGTTAMVGQTSPDVAAMQRAAQQHLGGPGAASADPTGNAASAPVGAARSPGAPLTHPNNPGAALHASGCPNVSRACCYVFAAPCGAVWVAQPQIFPTAERWALVLSARR
jgi:type IV secretion system protein VirB10